MFSKTALLLVLVGVALSAPADLYSTPTYDNQYYEVVNNAQYPFSPKPYNFAYGVQDEYAGTDFGQTEESDGNTVRGSYSVLLPDGRKQTVTYVADDYGYHAEVSYYGEAQYPYEYGPAITFRPQYQDSYQPAPSYQY